MTRYDRWSSPVIALYYLSESIVPLEGERDGVIEDFGFWLLWPILSLSGRREKGAPQPHRISTQNLYVGISTFETDQNRLCSCMLNWGNLPAVSSIPR